MDRVSAIKIYYYYYYFNKKTIKNNIFTRTFAKFYFEIDVKWSKSQNM